jgi:hypothetical protein
LTWDFLRGKCLIIQSSTGVKVTLVTSRSSYWANGSWLNTIDPNLAWLGIPGGSLLNSEEKPGIRSS